MAARRRRRLRRGLGVAGVAGTTSAARDAARDTESLRQQVSTLQARLHAREDVTATRTAAATAREGGPPAPRAAAGGERDLTAALREERLLNDIRARSGAQTDRAASRSGSGSAPTIESALDRFYKYLEATKGTEGRRRSLRAAERGVQPRRVGAGRWA